MWIGMVCIWQFLCSFFPLLFFPCSSMGFPYVLLFRRQKVCSGVGFPCGAVHAMKICSIVGFSTACRPITKTQLYSVVGSPQAAVPSIYFCVGSFMDFSEYFGTGFSTGCRSYRLWHHGVPPLPHSDLGDTSPVLALFVHSSSLCTVIFSYLSVVARYVISSVLSPIHPLCHERRSVPH